MAVAVGFGPGRQSKTKSVKRRLRKTPRREGETMKHQLTFGEYRTLDLGLFAAMLALSEFVIATAAIQWFPGQPFTVSVTAAMCAIVLMRWGAYAAVHAVVGGLVFCAVSGATAQQFLIYCVGNLGGLAALLLLRLAGKEKIRRDVVLSMLFGVVTLLLMQLGRAAVALVLGTQPATCVGFVTTDTLSGVFTMVIMYIVRRLDGVFEDQKSYLLRIREQK